jgi:hypothetical protein
LQEPQRQRPFAVILSGHAGREWFRHTIMANDRDHALEKAARMARRMQVELESVAPENPTLINWQEVETAADAAQARESDRAE